MLDNQVIAKSKYEKQTKGQEEGFHTSVRLIFTPKDI